MADEFEELARHRLRDLGVEIDMDSFAASFELARLSNRTFGGFDTEVHRPLGLSMAGFRVLFTVWVFESLGVREIARMAGVSRAAVSGVVTTLERSGLARRERDQSDGRLATVTVTDAGRATLSEAYREQNRLEQELFSVLDDDELQAFTATMRKLMASRRAGSASSNDDADH